MPKTAKKHFDEDLNRARSIITHASLLPSKRADKKLLRDDLFRAAWMYSVGAVDAYFCDAYADMLARVFRAKNLQPNILLPAAIENISLPVGTVFAEPGKRVNWKWRTAARVLIERDNVLSAEKIQKLFNHFFPQGRKLFEAIVVEEWVINRDAPKRLVDCTKAEYRTTSGPQRDSINKKAKKRIVARYTEIFQRRHDCIHNCDRPKQSTQTISETAVSKAVDDLRLLVEFCNEHFEKEFGPYLVRIGANPTTKSNAGYNV